METTKINSAKTASEISGLLGAVGAKRVMQEYGDDGQVTTLTFSIAVDGHELPYCLPVNTEAVFMVLQQRRPVSTRTRLTAKDREQALRVAWRQILRWVQAQLALIETGMVDTAEVFMPYLRIAGGQTLYGQFKAEGMTKMLPLLGAN